MQIKIVPNDKPNDDGKWITVATRPVGTDSFARLVAFYKSSIPAGWEAVSFRLEVNRLESKGGGRG